MEGPNVFSALRSHLGARRLRRPAPQGNEEADHAPLDRILAALAERGIGELEVQGPSIGAYLAAMEGVDPNRLSRAGALAFWMNVYNAGALDLARRTGSAGRKTVLRTPGAFDEPFVSIAGEALGLDGIEHGKIRRFGDPRIHSALVCGAVSCPTLRHEAFTGERLDRQLDDQMRSFLAAGGAFPEEGTLLLSRVFLWYSGDLVRPNRMPTLVPASKKRVARALRPWLGGDSLAIAESRRPRVAFQPYDWSLACAVG